MGPWPLLLFYVIFRCLELLFCECPCKNCSVNISMHFGQSDRTVFSDGPVEKLDTDAGKCPCEEVEFTFQNLGP